MTNVFLILFLSTPPDPYEPRNEKKRKNDRGQQAGFQVVARSDGNGSHYRRSHGTPKVTGQSQKGKHGRSSCRTRFRGSADGTRPHDAYGKAAERTAQKENETRKNGTATKVRETVSTSLQAVTITIGGTLVMFAFTMYNLLPLAGTVAVIAGLVCFFTGAPHALRTFIVGLVMLAVYLIVGAIFSKVMEPGGKKRS